MKETSLSSPASPSVRYREQQSLLDHSHRPLTPPAPFEVKPNFTVYEDSRWAAPASVCERLHCSEM